MQRSTYIRRCIAYYFTYKIVGTIMPLECTDLDQNTQKKRRFITVKSKRHRINRARQEDRKERRVKQ